MIVSQDLIEHKITVLIELSGHGVASTIPPNLFLLSWIQMLHFSGFDQFVTEQVQLIGQHLTSDLA